jgi:hypothetical protein
MATPETPLPQSQSLAVASPRFPCWEHLRLLGFVHFQGESHDEQDGWVLEHRGTDGFIHAFFDSYEERKGSVPDMLPDTIASCLGIIPSVAKRISARWKVVFDAAPFLFHGDLDYIRFIRDYFLQQEPNLDQPLLDSILRPGASNLEHSITIGKNPPQQVYSLHVAHYSHYWTQEYQLEQFQPLVDMLTEKFPKEQFMCFYHGTTVQNAGSILTDGVRLVGNRYQDFSNADRRGYYCSLELSHATNWAFRNASYELSRPAVVVHAIPLVEMDKLFQLQFDSDSPDWAFLVMSCRRNDRYPAAYPDYDCIAGPVCSNGKSLRRCLDSKPIPRYIDDDTMMHQWCILSRKCAGLFTRSIVGIVLSPP